MAEIKTLVDDIYALFQGHECDPKRVEAFGKELAQLISDRLAENRKDQVPTLRMSSIGRPSRQLWYDLNDSEGAEELPPNVRLKFLIGDVWEHVLLFLAEEAGHTVTHKQERVELGGVVGHTDACIDGVCVDVKSASTYSFEKFKSGALREDDSFGYMEQLAGYSTALGGLNGAFLAGDKTLGHLTLMEVPKEEIAAIRIGERIEHIKAVVADKAKVPERCYAPVEDGSKNYKTGVFTPNGNLKLAVGCGYCRHKKKCWADANGGVGLRTYIYSTGPRHFVRVDKELSVPEVSF